MISKLLLAAAVLAVSIPAQAMSGKLEFASGDVSVVRLGKTIKVKTGAELKEADEVRTGAGAFALLALDDGIKAKLRENGALELLPPVKGGISEIFLKLGGVFTEIKKRANGGKFRVRTPHAVASVRGTQFFTAYGRKKRKGHDLWLCVNEGAVEVEASGKAVTVKGGEGIIIKSGKDLTNPQSYDWTKTLNWNMDAGKPLEDKTNLDSAYSDLLDQDYK